MKDKAEGAAEAARSPAQYREEIAALRAALLVYIRAHDAAHQNALGIGYTTAECMCDTCCQSNSLYMFGTPPEYRPPLGFWGNAPQAPTDSLLQVPATTQETNPGAATRDTSNPEER